MFVMTPKIINFASMKTDSDKGIATMLRRGCRDGITMGFVFGSVFVLAACGTDSSLASLVALALAVSVPFMVYRRLAASYRADGCRATFAAVWLEGILTFGGGAIILALVTYLYLHYFDPTFVTRQVTAVSMFYARSDSASLRQLGQTFDNMVQSHMLPRPIDLAVTMAWAAAFTGAVTSLILSAIVKAKNHA